MTRGRHTDANAVADHGQFHQAAFYRTDHELLDAVLPFLSAGLAAGEPVLVTLRPTTAATVRATLPDPAAVEFLNWADGYANPATTIKNYRRHLARALGRGAAHVRLVGELDCPGKTTPWGPWARYEAAFNDLFAGSPLSSLCLYDERAVPDRVLDDVARTHPWLVRPGGERVASQHYIDAPTFLTRYAPATEDVTEPEVEPDLVLPDPAPEEARAAAHRIAETAGLGSSRGDRLVLAVSESVTNAVIHGTGPVSVRLWCGPDRIVAAVTDTGRGPVDPFAGLVPADRDRADGGLGLWIVHQVCDHVGLHRRPEGYTIVLVVDRARR